MDPAFESMMKNFGKMNEFIGGSNFDKELDAFIE